MDKETLSNYGWIVICVLVLAVMIALATPFGTFVAGAVKSTTQGLFDVNQSALNSTGLINIGDQEFDVPDMNHGTENGGNAGEAPVVPNEPETPSIACIHIDNRPGDNICDNCGVQLFLVPHDGNRYGYQFDSGMTFVQWVESEYNTDGFIIENNCIVNKTTNKMIVDVVTGKAIDPSAVIKNTYYFGTYNN